MNDTHSWAHAVEAARKKYERLPAETKSGLNEIIDQIMRLKDELLGLTLAKGGAGVCSSCGGICCNNGKYHLSVLDLMAFFYISAEIPVPDFELVPFCPYGNSDGCLMPPRLRPVTCIIFNCEPVDALLENNQRIRSHELEKQIRNEIICAEKLLGFRAGRPLLLSCDGN